jgi:DNA-binding response OmpR family regulator/tetratricopeptide (TPR) repeat protein
VAKTILIVEDEKPVARFMTELLEAEGHRVLVENDAEWGLKTFHHKEPDLVIIDVALPKMSGFDMVEQLRKTEKGRAATLMMVSGVYPSSSHQQAMFDRFAIADYLDKPFDNERFLERVRAALGQTVTTGRIRMVTGLLSIAPDVKAIDEPAPNAPTSLSLPKRGDLDQIPFARLFGQLHAARATGSLMLRKSAIKKIVYLKQGAPILVKSNLLGECLGHVMVRERFITEEECDRSVALLKETKRKQGQILIEMGSISPDNLTYALQRQLELKLFDLFSWLEGNYLFNDSSEDLAPPVAFEMSPLELVFEGVRRTMSVERVMRELESSANKYVLPSQEGVRQRALDLVPKAERLIDAIDGRTRLAELLARGDLPGEDGPILLYALACTSLLRFADQPLPKTPPKRSAPPSPPPPSEEIISLSEADLEAIRTGEVRPPPPSEERTKTPPPPPPLPDPSAELQLSPTVREGVRARLEAALHQRLSSLPVTKADAPPKPDHEAERKRLAALLGEKANELRSQDHYQRLGVARDAARAEIEAAFVARSREYPPDELAPNGSPPEVRALAEEIAILLRRAKDALLDPEERREHDREIDGPEDDRGVSSLLRAERAFARGLEHSDRGEWAEAKSAFEKAAAIRPDQGAYLAQMAWAAHRASPDDGRVASFAIAELNRAAALSPRSEDAYVFLGLIHEKLGNREEASKSFRRALQCNADSVRALRALRALEPIETKKGGLFGRA